MSSAVISPEALARELGRSPSSPALVLLDARTGPLDPAGNRHADARASSAAAHLPGARFVDLESELADAHSPTFDARTGGRHPLPSAERFAAILGELGVTPASDVVIYDLAAGANAAARAWWMLRAFGHAHVRVLEGTVATFREAGLVFTSEPSHWEPRVPYPATAFALPVIDAAGVDEARVDPAFVVLDARSGPRFRGEVEPIDPVAGHIPGARNLFHMDLVDAQGRMVPVDQIRARVHAAVHEGRGDLPGASADEPTGEHVVVHCGSGVTACHAMLAMDHAGLAMPTLYVGSWSEWCRSPRPIATSITPAAEERP